ncbi:MAG: hypothetical protein AB7F98_15915 [Novosphingobium sp.]
MFRVQVDEPVVGGVLVLNGHSAKLMHNVDGAYWAKWNGSDASGTVEVQYPDGSKTICQVGYVTHGMIEPQEFVIERRKCHQER